MAHADNHFSWEERTMYRRLESVAAVLLVWYRIASVASWTTINPSIADPPRCPSALHPRCAALGKRLHFVQPRHCHIAVVGGEQRSVRPA